MPDGIGVIIQLIAVLIELGIAVPEILMEISHILIGYIHPGRKLVYLLIDQIKNLRQEDFFFMNAHLMFSICQSIGFAPCASRNSLHLEKCLHPKKPL